MGPVATGVLATRCTEGETHREGNSGEKREREDRETK